MLPERVPGHRDRPPTCCLRPPSAASPVPGLPCSPPRCRLGSRVAPSKGLPLSFPLPLPAHHLPFAPGFSVLAAVLTAGRSYSAPVCLVWLLELKLFEVLSSIWRARCFYLSSLPAAMTNAKRHKDRLFKTAHQSTNIPFPQSVWCGAPAGSAEL